MFDNEDEDDDQDFLGEFFNKEEIQAIIERERAKSMEYAIDMLKELGIKGWYESIPYSERIERILTNMLNYFLDLEEFENCAIIRDAIIYGKTLKNKNEQI
jgi:protein-arginine kinase activator protein McsA